MSYPERFRNRTLLIATMHGKEKVIAPIIKNALGISTCVSNRFNTDELGTFTGEIKRKDDPLTTLRKKCELALDIHGADLVIGNEGSFGPHPGIFFLNADDELVMLIDRKHGLEIVAREVSTETNFAGQTISSHQELMTFAKKTGFPSHALILRDAVESRGMIVKGITDENQLTQSFDGIVSKFGSAYVETDMRAMFNPTRMKVIKKATEKLIAKLHQLCPECDTPGFDIDRSVPGLPCSLCGRATLSTLYHVCACKHCKYEQQKNNRHGKTNEDPMYCPFCNP